MEAEAVREGDLGDGAALRVLICILALFDMFAACGGEGSGSASEPLHDLRGIVLGR